VSASHIILVALLGVFAWAMLVLLVERRVVPWLARRCGDDPLLGLARCLAAIYCRWVHRLQIEGADALRAQSATGPLLVVANHTAGIDPLLVQSGCRFFIRWMMAADMMLPGMDDFWRLSAAIPVRRGARDTTALRVAIRHLRDGGVIGLFPEGGIARPPRRIGPFMGGVGLLAVKTRVPILLVWISGTPETPTAFGSLFRRSRSRVRFELLEPFPEGASADEATEALRERLAGMSGWTRLDSEDGDHGAGPKSDAGAAGETPAAGEIT